MATFSLGTSGVTPGAPGVYINERPGNIAFGEISGFSTVYMLVEADENVSTTTFPFNTPIPITSLADYRVLCGGLIPDSGIPLLSYQCVNAFYQNAQVGDLRVVRVGTPNQIVEIELLPSGSKINTTALPSALMAGDKVYVQMIINGMRLVAGDGSTGYTASGDWLGVPVEIPVNYVAGDEVNNRKISRAIVNAVAEAIKTNPAVSSSVVVRDFGLLVDVDPVLYANSQNGYVNISASVFDGNVSVITEVQPVGSNFVFMQNAYDINNIVGGGANLERIPQDYIQCIETAFDGQQDQGYLITPTAYAQFDSEGRAAVGAAAAAHCQNNNYKWMALADPGPYFVTGINKYKNFTPHPAAADFITGMKYLVDNVIYEWVGTDVTYNKATYQSIVNGTTAEIAVRESANPVAPSTQIGLLDSGIYNATSSAAVAQYGVYTLNSTNFWPVALPIQKVTVSGASAITNDLYPYNGQEVYVVAPGYTPLTTGTYPGTATQSFVYLAATVSAASAILAQVNAAGGTAAALAATLTPTGAILPQSVAGNGSTFTLTYADAYWDLPVTINGQTSDLIENITANPVGVNTLHLPGTLQDPTETYRLSFVSRTIFNPATAASGISPYGTTGPIATLGSLIGGTGYTPGTYVGVTLLGGAGSGAVATITVDATGQISAVAITTPGTNYNVGDVLSAPDSSLGGGGGSGFSTKVITVSGQVNNSYTGAAQFKVANHGLVNGQKIFFTQPIYAGQTQLIKNSTKIVQNTYYVTVTDVNTFIVSRSLTEYTAGSFVQYINQPISTLPTVFYSNVLGAGETAVTLTDLITIPLIRARKYGFDSSSIFNQSASSTALTASANNPTVSVYLNNSSVVLGEELISPFGEDYTTAGWLPSLNLPAPTTTPVASVDNAYCVPTVDQNYQSEAFMVPAINAIAGGSYDPTAVGTTGPVNTFTFVGGSGYSNGTYTNIPVSGGTGYGATFDITVAGGIVTACARNNAGWGYTNGDTLTVPGIQLGAGTLFAITLTGIVATTPGALTAATAYVTNNEIPNASSSNTLQAARTALVGVYFDVVNNAGFAPDGVTPVVIGDRISVAYNGVSYSWIVTKSAALGGDLSAVGQVCYWSQVEMVFTPEQTPPVNLWRFDAITSTELIDNALRGVGFNGVPQAVFVDAGVDNVNRLYDDSQRYFNPFGFIAYYGPWIDSNPDAEEIWLPPSPYVTGVAVRRYRAEGYQFPPAGVKYQLAGAYKAQIPINSAQQNLLNPDGCNAIRTLPGYPQTAVFIWGGRTRVNTRDAQQKLYQFVNTRVILNVVYGSLRSAFDSQIFNVIDGFGVIYNQIISVGNSILNQLYVKGALYGARPSDAFQVICDARINPPADLENGIVNAKVFVTPVPTLERIQIDLIRVAIGQMQNELDSQGLGTNNAGL